MLKFTNVYIKDTTLVAGPLEAKGPFKSYFDKTYKDYYMDKDYELSEVKMQNDSIDLLLKRLKLKDYNVDLLISGDLLNQLTASSYAARKYNIPYLGIFNACASSVEGIIIGSTFIDSKKINNAIVTVSSHNLSAEKQFRNPVEYGAPKKVTQTFTSTGAASIFLTNTPTNVKITSATIGKVIDFNQKDVNNMGAVMAPAFADSIIEHLKENNTTVDDYDMILSGDLGIYGMNILRDYMKEVYKINLKENYNDCGAMLYDMQQQKEITAGGSGPVCSCLVNYGFVYKNLKEKKFKKVLLATTGALFSPTFVYQKNSIPAICHVLEVESI